MDKFFKPAKDVEEPTQNGWYKAKDGNNWLLFSLSDGFNGKQWSAHALNGDVAQNCEWAYVAQVGDLELVASYY